MSFELLGARPAQFFFCSVPLPNLVWWLVWLEVKPSEGLKKNWVSNFFFWYNYCLFFYQNQGGGAIKLPHCLPTSEGPARVPITKPERLTSSMSLSGRKICNRKPLVGSWLEESRIGTQQFVYCFACCYRVNHGKVSWSKPMFEF